MSTARRRGKDTEREVAKLLGGKRVGHLGGQDVDAGLFAVETKSHLGEPPKWILDAILQARRHARKDQVAITIHQYHRGKGQPKITLVVLGMEEWMDLHGPVYEEVPE